MRIFAAWPIVALAILPQAAWPQTPVNACEPPAAIQDLAPRRRAGEIAKIREALEQSPDNLFLNRWLIELQPKPQTGLLADEFQEKPAKHPDDPRFLYLYARALVGKDT